MGIECWRQCWTISHDTNPCMTMTMNATLMRLRTAKPPLQVQVIARIGGHLGAHEQARAKRCHHLCEVRIGLIVCTALKFSDLCCEAQRRFVSGKRSINLIMASSLWPPHQ